AAAGAEVVLTARTAEAATQAAAELSSAGGKLRGVALDVAEAASLEAVLPGLIEDYGTIPLLVNNAGITRDNLLLRLKPEDWDLVVRTNLSGAYRTCRALLPAMIRARYGRIVNVSSVIAGAGNAGQTNYAAAKAGLEGFTRSLAREVASRNVTVNCVAPGIIDTEMTQALDEETRRRLLGQVPLGRLGQPADVAGAVRFLLGPAADYVTGITLHVNGGMYM
ncbi:MAG TPA: 3-oxoacyl-ACP reductase FabG, partial [Candidatus Polarisedimenticolaceae bacterium]|nr:3-oxoacyl-ACP reductase FabG [Candidatus Polarisedimenticolaceae bacterium]